MVAQAAVLLTCWPLAGAPPSAPMAEGFETDVAALRKAGWVLPSTCSVTTDGAKVGGKCLKVDVTRASDRYASLFIPVERGKCYRAAIWIRCKDVKPNPELRLNRGAVIFCQWANAKRGWEPGGTFPNGLVGTRGWTRCHVPLVRPIPGRVATIQLMLGVEGTGTAWFDDVTVEEIRRWDGVEMLAPPDGATLDVRLPRLRWRPKGKQQFGGAMVELSRAADFAGDATTRVPVDGHECRPPALGPGTWHWRVRLASGDGHLPPGPARSFAISEDALLWPPTIVPRLLWAESDRPTLHAEVVPECIEATFAATIDGKPARMIGSDNGVHHFQPAEPLPPGIHPVTITASHGRRTESVSTFCCNKAPARQITFRDDNVMLIDGKPFFPIGAYRDPSDTLTDFSGLLEAGFNTTHNYTFETPRVADVVGTARRYLRAAHKHGLKVFMGLDRKRIDGGDHAWCQRFAAELMDEPALLTWYLRDEPDGARIPPSKMRRLKDAVRAIDPVTPTSIVYCVPSLFKRYGDVADVFWADPYPVPNRPLAMVQDLTRLSREAAGPKRPVWIVLQGFDWRYTRNPKAVLGELGKATRPTARETRCMAFMALANGANGLIWYWSPNNLYHIKRDAPEVWKGIRATVDELNKLMPFLVAPAAVGDAIAVPEPFAAWSKQTVDERVLALVNTSPKPAKLSLELDRFGQGPIAETFGPHEVKVRRWRLAK